MDRLKTSLSRRVSAVVLFMQFFLVPAIFKAALE
jgi:hypothetical protein